MENSKAVLLLATIALAGVSVFLFLAYNSAHAQASEAELLGLAVRDLLRAQRTPCSASATSYANLAACIQPLLAMRDFKEDSFKQPDSRTNAPGYLVIQNTNNRAYEAEQFVFLYNRVELQEGCKDLTGDVNKDVTCRFDFLQYCEKGTVLEVTYPILGDDGQERPVRVFLKSC